MKKYQDWAKKEYSWRQRIVTLVLAGTLVVLIIPTLIVISSNAIDGWLHLPKFTIAGISPVIAVILIVGGLGLGLWSIEAQLTLGSGTPVPIMPTKKLIVRAPFSYCRNPMTLGTILAYLGFCVWIGSLSALLIALFLISLLLLYLKLVEEKELEARFGSEYLEYKRSTPFILPRFRHPK